MSDSIRAIYENGVFKPLETLSLPEHQQVRLQIEAEHANDTPAEQATTNDSPANDPLAGIRVSTGISDLAENFDDYRFGKRKP